MKLLARASVVVGEDLQTGRRTLERLGLAELDRLETLLHPGAQGNRVVNELPR
jgi:hypothetical protein